MVKRSKTPLGSAAILLFWDWHTVVLVIVQAFENAVSLWSVALLAPIQVLAKIMGRFEIYGPPKHLQIQIARVYLQAMTYLATKCPGPT